MHYYNPLRKIGVRSIAIAFVLLGSSLSGQQAYSQAGNADLRNRLLRGEPVEFKSEAPRTERTLPAEWIGEAARKAVPIRISNASIDGDLNLVGLTVEASIELTNCDFTGEADFSETTFKHAVFLDRTVFQSAALFNDAVFEHGAFLAAAHFRGISQFHITHFEGPAIFQSAVFDDEVLFSGAVFEDQANFSGATFGSYAKFVETKMKLGAFFLPDSTVPNRPTVNFKGPADFTHSEMEYAFFFLAHFARPAIFRSIKVAHEADFQRTAFDGGADFSSAEIGRSITFGRIYDPASRSTFGHTVNFDGAWIGTNAFFDEVNFTAKGELLNLENMRIGGVLSLAGAQCAGKVSFSEIEVAGQAQFSGAIFGDDVNFEHAHIGSRALFGKRDSPKLNAATFEGNSDFGGARFGADLDFRNVVFKKKTEFQAAQLEGPAIYSATEFRGGLDFAGTSVKQRVSFTNARFGGSRDDVDASFMRARFGSDIYFDGAEFDGTAVFESAEVDGPAIFSGAVFRSDAVFGSMEIRGNAVFDGSRFAASRYGAYFDDVEVSDNVSFVKSAFAGPMHFARAHVSGESNFNACEFKGAVNFEGSEFGGRIEFSDLTFPDESRPVFSGDKFLRGISFQNVVFETTADFSYAQADSDSEFRNVTFQRPTKFDGFRFGGTADFGTAGLDGTKPALAQFADRVSFANAEFQREANFEYATFAAEASFREASFRTLFFSPTGKVGTVDQFRGKIDFRGCTYDRIQVEWSDLVKRIQPYDRQPFSELEKTYRAVGQDPEGNRVRVARYGREKDYYWDQGGYSRLALNIMYWALLNYGVDWFWHLLLLTSACWAIGMWAFWSPRAVRYKVGYDRECYSKFDSFRLTVRLFLPVELSIASRWEPSDASIFSNRLLRWLKYSDVGGFLKVMGWIIVPLFVLELTNLLLSK